MAALLKEYENLVIKKIDIGPREGSEAGRQMVRDYNARGIPYLRVFGTQGELLGEVTGSNLPEIRRLIDLQAKKK